MHKPAEQPVFMGQIFRNARRLVLTAVLLSLLLPLVLCLDGWLRARDQDRPAMQWMQRLALSSLALWPAGTPLRHSEMFSPTVDLRLSPLIPHGKRMVPEPLGAAGGVRQP